MTNKKTAMAASGLMILMFHLWVTVAPGSMVEPFLKACFNAGVDIFFFLSAWSMAGRKVDGYLRFLWSRFRAVYIKFVLFAVVAAVYSGWKMAYLVKVVTMQDLFTKGGGAFLWFLPAIMLAYVLFPVLQKFDEKAHIWSIVISFGLWAIGAGIATALGWKQIFIFWNRIPVFLLGYYLGAGKFGPEFMKKNKQKAIIGAVLTVLGTVLVYFFAFRPKLQVPFTDMFYVVTIPLAIGLILLLTLIPDRGLIRWMGSSTLEMYGIQMVFGYNFARWMLRATKNPWAVNVASIVFVTLTAVVVHYAYAAIQKRISLAAKK